MADPKPFEDGRDTWVFDHWVGGWHRRFSDAENEASNVYLGSNRVIQFYSSFLKGHRVAVFKKK